jgi:endonuclease/exonuclease/phosphatase family metal-dependent hydrolase
VIKVASYNIRKAIGTDRLRRPTRILDVIAEINPDIIALQEADRRFGSRSSAIPQDLIIHETRYRAVGFATKTDGIGWHGNAILVDDAIEIVDQDIINIPSLEPRGAVFAELRGPNWGVQLVAMHLDLSGLLRKRQIRSVLAYITKRKCALPALMMGDLNEWSRKGGALRELPADYRIAPTSPSFHAQRPIAHLDRIITGPGIRVKASGTHHSATAQRASDHLPIWATLDFD